MSSLQAGLQLSSSFFFYKLRRKLQSSPRTMSVPAMEGSTTKCLGSSCFHHLLAAFLAMEPTHCLISLARECGGGFITNEVQSFIWEHCISSPLVKINATNHLYIKNFIKKIIVATESSNHDLLSIFYEKYAYYMTSVKDDGLVNGDTRVNKIISFLFPHGHSGNQNCPKPAKVVIPLQCSVNMLEGDTGCSIWPSSLFLSEFILSYPEIFSDKSCFEVGSGVGLVGICLAFVNSCKVILSDGDLSSLVNLKLNLEMNQLQTGTKVDCKHLPWESASASELQDFSPDVVLGADVIYDPSCMPHLVQVLTILLARKKCYANEQTENYSDGTSRKEHIYDEVHNADDEPSNSNRGRTWGDLPKGNGSPNINKIDSCKCQTHQCHGLDHSHNNTCPGSSDSKDETVCGNKLVSGSLHDGGKDRPVAYIATVIRNADTFDYFLKLANQTGLIVVDITERQKPLNLLPYMLSYERSSIRLYVVYLCD